MFFKGGSQIHCQFQTYYPAIDLQVVDAHNFMQSCKYFSKSFGVHTCMYYFVSNRQHNYVWLTEWFWQSEESIYL